MGRKKATPAATEPVEANANGAEETPGKKNILVQIPEELHSQLRLLATLQGVTMIHLTVEAITEYVSKPQYQESLRMFAAMQAKLKR